MFNVALLLFIWSNNLDAIDGILESAIQYGILIKVAVKMMNRMLFMGLWSTDKTIYTTDLYYKIAPSLWPHDRKKLTDRLINLF